MKHHSVQREYWRSLEDLGDKPQVREAAKHEFASYDPDGLISMPEVTRRKLLKLVSASMALAGLTLTGCRRWPVERLAPYTSNPKNRLPGVPEQYATVMEIDGVATPLLVTSFDGRPIKIEGNPTHPFSATVPGKIGAADAIAQASVLEMYDPDRSRGVMAGGKESNWDAFSKQFAAISAKLAGSQGQGFAILAEPLGGPSAQRLKAAVMARFPKAQWIEYSPLSRANETVGLKAALGKPARQWLSLDKAKIIVSFDADLLGSHPAHVRYASDWAAGRRTASSGVMSRVYIAESVFSTTGSIADVRLAARPSRLGALLGAIGQNLGLIPGTPSLSGDEKSFVDRVTADLTNNVGGSVVAVGSHLPVDFHTLALAINSKIRAIGNTLTLLEEPEGSPDNHFAALADLTAQLKKGSVNTLLILGGNPAYDAPADLEFASALKMVPASIHLSNYQNETSQLCGWHVPRAHYLEAWSDARAWDGTVSVCQPLIEPLFGGKTSDEILAVLAGEKDTVSDAIVRTTFASMLTTADFDLAFRKVLNDGLLDGTAFKSITPSTLAAPPVIAGTVVSGFEVRFMQDYSVYDGRFAGNGWLQEMPDPLTKVVWDNPAVISVADAKTLDVSIGDILNITIGGRSLQIAAYILPGQPTGVIGLPLGYGRSAAGHIGTDVGFNTYSVRAMGSEFSSVDVKVSKTGDSYTLATTQNDYMIDDIGSDGRDERIGKGKYSSAELIKEAKLDQYRADSKMFQRNDDGSVPLELFEPTQISFSDPHKWGMAIDMSSCIGCHACVVACQAENNIPIVGKDQVVKNRQMHWIRIDRYFKGGVDDQSPEVVYQPLTCQQCENAPCEQVCPVGATMHDTEGVNVMVYNRCVGTRYCSNNCPYKVRRFNYLDFHSQDPRHDKYPPPFLGIPDQQQLAQVDEIKRMVFNPEVTVRMRGVMEKCSFCLQRIHLTQINKGNAGEKLADGDIITACQQSCPTQAIVFGDLNDPNSQVSRWHKDDRAYGLLAEALNTRPRNRYLAKISNPGPA